MHDVETQVTRAHYSQQGIEIGTISVHQCPSCMNQIDYFLNMLIEQAQRIGIGEH
jgi:hypothetical protein